MATADAASVGDLLDDGVGGGGGATGAIASAAEVVDDDAGAAAGEFEGIDAAEAAAGPGDHRHLPVKADLGGPACCARLLCTSLCLTTGTAFQK